MLLLLILVAGLLSPGLPRLWRFVLTRATVATHPLPSLPLPCSELALRLAEGLVKHLKATGRARLYYGAIPYVPPMVPPPTPICERPCICAVVLPRSTFAAYRFPNCGQGKKTENEKVRHKGSHLNSAHMTITVCHCLTRFHQNIARLHMTLHPDLCTSCALYFFPVFYSNVGKNYLLFYFICVFILILFYKVQSQYFSPLKIIKRNTFISRLYINC